MTAERLCTRVCSQSVSWFSNSWCYWSIGDVFVWYLWSGTLPWASCKIWAGAFVHQRTRIPLCCISLVLHLLMVIARACGIGLRTVALSDHSDSLGYVTLVVFDIYLYPKLIWGNPAIPWLLTDTCETQVSAEQELHLWSLFPFTHLSNGTVFSMAMPRFLERDFKIINRT